MIRNTLWRAVAHIASRPAIADWLIRRAQRTPYTPILSADNSETYMGRWWLANGYHAPGTHDPNPRHVSWLPSVRVHHICVPDQDRDLHSHPWVARSIILRGWYIEESEARWRLRMLAAGDTYQITPADFHRIRTVPDEGVWTLFITWGYSRSWGFKVGDEVVPWREYVAARDAGK